MWAFKNTLYKYIYTNFCFGGRSGLVLEYLRQQKSECGTASKETTVCVCYQGNEVMCHPVLLTDVFLMFSEQ